MVLVSADDAAYPELAIHRGLTLATVDDKHESAALNVGVALYAMH